MLNPYPIYQNPVPGTSNHLQFEPDRDSASPTPSESSNRSDDRNKRSSWSLTEERCLIAAFKEYYDRLKSTKSSQAKKNIWEDILKQFQSMCFDNGVESEKSLAQTITKLWLVPSAKQRRDPCSGPPTDSTNYRKCVSNFPSTWLAITTLATNKTKVFFNWPIVVRTQIRVHSWKSRTRISALFRRRS